MSYHVFQKKGDNQSMFSTKNKKIKSKSKSQNRKEYHEHCTNFRCIALYHMKLAFTALQDKGCMHLHPQKSCSMDRFLFKNEKPSQRVNLMLSHKVEPFGTSAHWLVS